MSHWLDRLVGDHDNFREALGCAIEPTYAESALRLGGVLWRYWFLGSHLGEGRCWLEGTLSLPGGAVPSVGAKALSGRVNLW